MTDQTIRNDKKCLIIGASHAGVNAAFALRKEGFVGDITLIDADPTLPYHRPPLSKAYLTTEGGIDKNLLKSADSYQKNNIQLLLGCHVKAIDLAKNHASYTDSNGVLQQLGFDQLIFATGARPFIPPISGIDSGHNIFPLRTAKDVSNIKQVMATTSLPKVVIIGGGYIGLETAASLQKLGANVTILEREARLLARVTSPFMSEFFNKLHVEHGVNISCNKNVEAIIATQNGNTVRCEDGTIFEADLIIVGVGIRVNTALAEHAGVSINNGIEVDEYGKTSKPNVFAIGDCTYHKNQHYNRWLRLESVQNAVDQAKNVARTITGHPIPYDTIPWFWSDQYNVKLQMVGLSQGYDEVIVRHEDTNKFSVWYFKGQTLLAVDAVNSAKSYVIGTKAIKNHAIIDKSALSDASIAINVS